MSLQYVLGIPPALRENIDYVFLFASDGNNLKKIWENYAGIIPTFKMFKFIFSKCTSDHSCMVIDKTNTSTRLEDKVFYYKARNPGKFRFGSKQFWRFHDENYKSDDDSNDESNAQKKLRNMVDMYAENGYLISVGDDN